MRQDMCLAVPLKIVRIDNLVATVDMYGGEREVSLMLLPEAAQVGDYVLVHAGFALQKLDEEAANESLALFREMAQGLEEKNGDPRLPAHEDQ
jgi:hydrogenase expression/formation protein HypC